MPCIPVSTNAQAWINCKGTYSQNILVACLFDMKFTYMLNGWEGFVHDSRVLNDVISPESRVFSRPPKGTFLVYIISHQFIIISSRYFTVHRIVKG